MIRLRRAIVIAFGDARPGAHELEVDVDGERATAIAYPDLCGPVTVGDVVILNTTAVSLALGTGGVHFVVAVEGAQVGGDDAPGRVMKARYTPLQTAVSSVEETHRDELERSSGLEQTPVVCAPLHSMLGPIAAGAKRAGDARVVYVMTDGAALPGAFSRSAFELRDAGLIDGWITQRTGVRRRARGRHRVVRHAGREGRAGCGRDRGGRRPGEPGHRYHLGGQRPRERQRAQRRRRARRPTDPVVARQLRRSAGATPERLASLADDPPRCLPGADRRARARAGGRRAAERRSGRRSATAKLEDRHQLVEVDGRPALAELADRGIEPRSMGRGVADDPAYFLAAGAAGVLAGRTAAGNRRWRAARDASS